MKVYYLKISLNIQQLCKFAVNDKGLVMEEWIASQTPEQVQTLTNICTERLGKSLPSSNSLDQPSQKAIW